MQTQTFANSQVEQQAEQARKQPFSMKMPTVSLIIPTLNEAKNLPYLLPYIPEYVTEVIIVDGRSKDNTVEVARQLRPDVKIVLEQRRGKGAALQAGFKAATSEILVMIDADGSMDPNEIFLHVGALLQGADFVKGSRFIQGGGTADMTLFRRLGNLGLTIAVRALFGGTYSDLCYGYNTFWAKYLDTLNLDCDGFEIETLMNVRALRAGLRITEVPSFEADRIFGTSNLNAIKDGIRVLKTILRERFKRGVYSAALKQPAAPKSAVREQPVPVVLPNNAGLD